MSRDSMVSSLPSDGWSCATLQEGIEVAAQQAGLTLKTQDYTKARMHVHHIDIYHQQAPIYKVTEIVVIYSSCLYCPIYIIGSFMVRCPKCLCKHSKPMLQLELFLVTTISLYNSMSV